MDILITLLGFLAGAITTILVVMPVVLPLLVQVEKLTAEGTKIDSGLDRAISILTFVGKYATIGNAQKLREVEASLKARKNSVE